MHCAGAARTIDRMLGRLTLALVLVAGPLHAQTEPAKPPTIIVPPKPAPTPLPPAGIERPREARADFCCTPYGRFGPIGGDGRPGALCQWTLPSSVAQGSTCP